MFLRPTLPLVILAVLALFLGRTEANSAGIGVPCKSVLPNAESGIKLGHPERGTADAYLEGEENAAKKKETIQKLNADGYKMWWATPSEFDAQGYSFRSGDGAKAADPTSYTPGLWMNLYLRSFREGYKFQGLVVYAVDQAGKTVGEWQPRPDAPFRYGQDAEGNYCLTHSNAGFKDYRNVFRFKAPPKGTGTIKFLVLVKEGMAFPEKDGRFVWPNAKHLELQENGQRPTQVWFQGRAGQSCDEVCANKGGTCDENLLNSVGKDRLALEQAVESFTQCTAPLMAGCAGTTPAVGTEGCFYHKRNCDETRAPTSKFVKPDPCEGIDTTTGDSRPNIPAKTCVKWTNVQLGNNAPEGYQQYVGSNRPVVLCNNGNGQQQCGQDRFQNSECVVKGYCAPPGGFTAEPTPAAPPAPKTRLSAEPTCDAKHPSEKDGKRLCPCQGATKITVPSIGGGSGDDGEDGGEDSGGWDEGIGAAGVCQPGLALATVAFLALSLTL